MIGLLRRREMVGQLAVDTIDDSLIHPLVVPIHEDGSIYSTGQLAAKLNNVDIVATFNKSKLKSKKYAFTIASKETSIVLPNNSGATFHYYENDAKKSIEYAPNMTITPSSGSTHRYIIVCGEITQAQCSTATEWLFTGYCNTHTIGKVKHCHISTYYTSIGSFFGSGCSGRAIIPEWIKSIGYRTFHSCDLKGELYIHDNITSLGSQCFHNCNFTSCYVGKNVASENQSLSYCKNLKKLYINTNKINTISSFFQFAKLEEIIIGEDVDKFKLQDGVLYFENGTQKVCLTSTLYNNTNNLVLRDCTEIKNEAFSGRKNIIGKLTLPNGLKVIGTKAFLNCTGLTGDLYIPDSVTSFDSFDGCTGLNGSLHLPAHYNGEVKGFRYCPFTGELIFPQGTTSVGLGAFEGCAFSGDLVLPEGCVSVFSSFSNSPNAFFGGKIVLPSTFTSILNYRDFEVATTIVHCYATTPPSVTSNDVSILHITELHIPIGSKDAYISDPNWSKVPNIIDDLTPR